jgi:hypothetical protein
MKRFSRIPVFTMLACALVTVAFVDIDVGGVLLYRDDGVFPGFDECQFYHGWPTSFAEHLEEGVRVSLPDDCGTELRLPLPPRFLDHVNPSTWKAFSFASVKAAVLVILLHVMLIAATGVAVFRLERRQWKALQFSIADMLSLTAIAGMILGLLCLDETPFLVNEGYLNLGPLPLFDRVMVLVAIACAVGLIVSTAIGRLGGKKAA